MAVLGWLTSHYLILILSWVGIRALVTPINPDGSLCAVGISGSALLGPALLPCWAAKHNRADQVSGCGVRFISPSTYSGQGCPVCQCVVCLRTLEIGGPYLN